MNEALTLTFADLDEAAERLAGSPGAQPLALLSHLVAPYRSDFDQYGGFATTPVPDRYGQGDPLPPFAQPLLHAALAQYGRVGECGQQEWP